MLKLEKTVMSNIIYVKTFVFVDLFLVAVMGLAMGLKVKPLEIGTSGIIPCGHIENDPDVRLVQWYKSRNIDAFENGDPSLASRTEKGSISQPNYRIDNTTFSLAFGNVSLEDQGLYKCYVVHGDLLNRSNYYTRTVTYALPRMDPVIAVDTDLNRVNCTVEHVKPAIYPVFNFGWIPDSNETYVYVVQNEDGTYTTSVCCALPQNKIASRIKCSFSYLHYQREASIYLPDITTEGLMENVPTTVSPMGTSVTFEVSGCRAIGRTPIIVSGIFILFVTVANVIMLIWWIKLRCKRSRGVKTGNRAKESEEKMIQPAMTMVV